MDNSGSIISRAQASVQAGNALQSVRTTAASEILQIASRLREKAERTEQVTAEKLSSISRQSPPSEIVNKCSEDEWMPEFFDDLRNKLRAIDRYLNSIDDYIDRVEI